MYGEKSEMGSKRKARTRHNHKLNVKTLRETAKFVLMFVNRTINYFFSDGTETLPIITSYLLAPHDCNCFYV